MMYQKQLQKCNRLFYYKVKKVLKWKILNLKLPNLKLNGFLANNLCGSFGCTSVP